MVCFARQARTVSMGRPVVNPMRPNQNLRVFWKPVNLQDCVWENLYRIIMKTILQEKGTIHCSKRHGYHIQTARVRRTSSGCSICLYPSKHGRCSKIIGMSRHLDSCSTTQMAKIMVQHGRPVVPLERNLYGHPLAGLFWERQFEKILFKYGGEKFSNWECLFVHREKNHSFLCL